MLAFGCHYFSERFQNLLFADSTAFVCRIRILARSSEWRFDLRAIQLTIALCSLLLPAPAEFSAQPPPPDATLAADPVFQKNCAKCHGKTAGGRHFGGPSLISQKTVAIVCRRPSQQHRQRQRPHAQVRRQTERRRNRCPSPTNQKQQTEALNSRC